MKTNFNASSNSENVYQNNTLIESNILDVGKYVGVKDKIDDNF